MGKKMNKNKTCGYYNCGIEVTKNYCDTHSERYNKIIEAIDNKNEYSLFELYMQGVKENIAKMEKDKEQVEIMDIDDIDEFECCGDDERTDDGTNNQL
jgi:hypothetical protein